MSNRHIHTASLSLRYGDTGVPINRPHDGYRGGNRGWARSPLARAIADREKSGEEVPYRKRTNAPQGGAAEQTRPPERVHPGWMR